MGLESKGGGLEVILEELRALVEPARHERVLRDVAAPLMAEQARRNLDTAGAYGGQGWSFAETGETQYERRKAALHGAEYAARPLVLPPGRARLAPSLTELGGPGSVLQVAGSELTVGTDLDYAQRLLETGGVGPTGEPYPARNPYQMTEAQRAEHERRIFDALLEDCAADWTHGQVR